jgi:hypothetical protein
MTPAQRRRALSGRVLELAGAAKLGNGERSIQIEERNKAAKRVREGMKKKQSHRLKARLEEVSSCVPKRGSQIDVECRPNILETITR